VGPCSLWLALVGGEESKSDSNGCTAAKGHAEATTKKGNQAQARNFTWDSSTSTEEAVAP